MSTEKKLLIEWYKLRQELIDKMNSNIKRLLPDHMKNDPDVLILVGAIVTTISIEMMEAFRTFRQLMSKDKIP